MTGGIVLGLFVGVPAGYAAGRLHKAVQVWQQQRIKVKRDRRDLRRGPRW